MKARKLMLQADDARTMTAMVGETKREDGTPCLSVTLHDENGASYSMESSVRELSAHDFVLDFREAPSTSIQTKHVRAAIDGETLYFWRQGRAYRFHLSRGDRRRSQNAAIHGHADVGLCAPMPGTVTRIFVQEGDIVEVGQALYGLEAMKMETIVKSMLRGTVKKLLVSPGTQVNGGDEIVDLDAES